MLNGVKATKELLNALDSVKKPPTNADRIRSMTDEELAAFLCKKFGCHSDTCPGIELCKPNEGKANGLLKWLQQPAEPPKEELA